MFQLALFGFVSQLICLGSAVLLCAGGCGSAAKPPVQTTGPQSTSRPASSPPSPQTPPLASGATNSPETTSTPALTDDSEDVKRLFALGATRFPQLGPRQFLSNDSIRQIDFDNQPQSDSDFAIIESFPNVKMLKVSSGKITDAGMTSVGKLTHLQELWLTSVPVTDSGLAPLTGLAERQKIILQGIPISDQGLAHLKNMKTLKLLHLGGCGGIADQSIEHLQSLKSLESLHLERTKVTPAGLEQLRKALPGCRVVL